MVFSAQYYPARPYKIWEFYDRNMTKSSVPWAGWSDYNLTAMSRWDQVPYFRVCKTVMSIDPFQS